jgi:hypothetical protein
MLLSIIIFPLMFISWLIMLAGFPLAMLVEGLSSQAATWRRKGRYNGPNGEGQLSVLMDCGLVTIGGVLTVGIYFAAKWLG